MALALLDAAVLTDDGSYLLHTISLEAARWHLAEHHNKVNSAIGDESTAKILSTLLQVPVEVNRQEYIQRLGEVALVFKMSNTILPTATNLTEDELHAVGYTFKFLIKVG